MFPKPAPPRKKFSFRFAIGSVRGPRSGPWLVKKSKADIYVIHNRMGDVLKVSFHQANVCRYAITRERATRHGKRRIVLRHWERADVSHTGSGQIQCVLAVCFPTGTLSTNLGLADENIAWIPAAAEGMTRVVEFLFTKHDKQTFLDIAKSANRQPCYFFESASSESFAVVSHEARTKRHEFRIPASDGEKRDLVISDADPNATGRPVRLTLFGEQIQGNTLVGWDFGAYWESNSTLAGCKASMLVRLNVFHRE